MKRSWVIATIIVVALGGWLGYSYNTRAQNGGGTQMTAVGSTALQPLVEAAGEDYAGEHLGVFINVQGGGTGTGLSQVQTGAVTMGNSDLFAEEKEGINAKNLVDHQVAVVGITAIVNKEAGIKELTQDQLIKIFTGKIKNWQQVGGKNLAITLLNRAAGSGTRAVFEKWGLKGAQSAPAPEQDSSGMVRSIVATTPGAISYVAFSYADKSVQAVALDHVQPTVANVTTNTWKIWAYEHVYTKGQPKGQVADFLKYLQSEKIQNTVVPQLGYISIHDMHVSRTADGQIVNK